MADATSPYLNRPLRSLAEVEALRSSAVDLCALAGLHRCPHAPAAGPVVVCGCAPGDCADRALLHVKQAAA